MTAYAGLVLSSSSELLKEGNEPVGLAMAGGEQFFKGISSSKVTLDESMSLREKSIRNWICIELIYFAKSA
jgi:hypothetical protein